MEKLFHKKITRDIVYKHGMFADESDFNVIRKHINIEYEPLMIPIANMMTHEAVILKTGGLVITDGDDVEWNDDFVVPEHWDSFGYIMTDEEKKLSRDNSHYTIWTMYLDTGNIQVGSIQNIPMDVMVCTLVLKVNLQNEIDLRDESMGIKTRPNYLTQDELTFLTN